MKTVTRFRRKSRLSSLIDQAGGVSVGVALKQATANLEPMKAPALELVAGYIDDLERLARPRDDESTQQQLAEVYRLGLAVLDTIGPFDLPHLHRAAWGLCDLSDRYQPDRPFDWRVVTVHVRALSLFLSPPPGGDPAAFDAVVVGLDQALARQRAA